MHRTRVDRPAIAATAVAFLATLTLAWLALAQSDSEEVTRTCSAEGYCPGWTVVCQYKEERACCCFIDGAGSGSV